jgi:K+-transporting ATPase ATPase A chain
VTANAVLQLVLYVAVLVTLAQPLGAYMARVYEGEPIFLRRVFGPIERFAYRLSGVREDGEMSWKLYAVAMLVFNLAGLLVVYALQRLQGGLPSTPR